MRPRSPHRGFTLIEAMMMMAVLALGLGAAASVVTTSAQLSRRNLAQTQGYMVAERELERLTFLGCDGANPNSPCANLLALDNSTRMVWWGANGDAYETAPGPSDPPRRQYRIRVDVDAPGQFEGAELGEPDLTRSLAGAGAGNQVNVRVQVSWTENEKPTQIVALQTRIAP